MESFELLMKTHINAQNGVKSHFGPKTNTLTFLEICLLGVFEIVPDYMHQIRIKSDCFGFLRKTLIMPIIK